MAAAAKEKNKKSGKYSRPSSGGRAKRPFRSNSLEDLKVIKPKLEEIEASSKPVASSSDLFSQESYSEVENTVKSNTNTSKKGSLSKNNTKIDNPITEVKSETNTKPDMAKTTKKTAKTKGTTSSTSKKKGTSKKQKNTIDTIKEAVTPELEQPLIDRGSEDVDVRIKRTDKYSKFKINESNRIVNRRHVNDLKNKISNKNLLHSNPITVNSDWEILDGQHRFQAAKELGLPVYYIVDDYMDIEDIAVINSTSKGWKLDDYLHHFRTEELAKGKEGGEYGKLGEFCEDYNVNLYNAIGLLSGRNSQPNAELIHKFKRGEFKVVDMEHAIRVANLRDSFKPYAPDFYKSKNFVNSLSKVARNENFDEDVMLKKMGQQSERLMKCATVEGYLNSLVDIYNFRTRKEYKLHLEDN
jgi:hypothetical protein